LNKRVNLCRVCGGKLFIQPLLMYEDSPKSAQSFLESLDDLDDAVNLEIFQCKSCGLIQHNLPPVSYYKEVIRAVAFSKEMGEFRRCQLRDWIDKNNLKDKKILEVGCGKGEYIDLLLKAGAGQVLGIEYSENSRSIASERGTQIYSGYLDSDFQPPKDFKFQAFTIFSFLEHWPNPNEGLGLLNLSLTEDACGLVEVPNFELILSKGLYAEFTTDHIFYFDKKTFTFLLEKNGFEVLSIDTVWYDYILSAQVRKRPKLNVANFLKVQEKIKSQLYFFIKNHPHGTIALWGAGHQALAVIAMSGLAKSIKYIVDSAPFKQGKYTPATHLPIVNPETLLTDPPSAVIVMAAGYSNEVIQVMHEKYPTIKYLAVLREDQLEIIQ